jgi:hypothetical protein
VSGEHDHHGVDDLGAALVGVGGSGHVLWGRFEGGF